MSENKEKIIATNRKARHDYHVIDTMETGIVLTGTEVKSLREGKANLKDSYARVQNEEVYLYNTHISPYSEGSYNNHEPLRQRKLLLHKKEIRKLIGKVQEKGLTMVPLKLYFKNGKVKVELAIVRGKKMYDKRRDIDKRESEREIKRHLSAKRIGIRKHKQRF
jgi:SsrA-binding protein